MKTNRSVKAASSTGKSHATVDKDGWHLSLWWVADVPSSFPVYLVGVLPLTYLFTWLWDHTRGGVLIALLFHASLNTSLARLPIFPVWEEWTILIWMVAVSACIFEWARGASHDLTKKPGLRTDL